MPFSLDQVVPWGRSFDEYVAMFALDDLNGSILGCADGPASFNAEATQRGGQVVSCDPLYAHEPSAIQARIDETYDVMMRELHANLDSFVWTTFDSPEHLGAVRMAAMRRFLADFSPGHERYRAASLPDLPFRDQQFDLALCSHFLFLYSDQLTLDFHIAAVDELMRVASEVRLFPLLMLSTEPSPYVEPVIEYALARGWHVEKHTVPYEFQRGGNQMLKISGV